MNKYGKRGRRKFKKVIEISKPDWFYDLLEDSAAELIRVKGPMTLTLTRSITTDKSIEIFDSTIMNGGDPNRSFFSYFPGENFYE